MREKQATAEMIHVCRQEGMTLRLAHATLSNHDPFDFGTEKYEGVCESCGSFTLVDFWGNCAKCKRIPLRARV